MFQKFSGGKTKPPKPTPPADRQTGIPQEQAKKKKIASKQVGIARNQQARQRRRGGEGTWGHKMGYEISFTLQNFV